MELSNKLFKGDKVVWVIFMLLCLISLIEVFSATSTLAYKSGDHWGPIKQHSLFLLGGAFVVGIVHNTPLKLIRFLGPLILVVSGIMLVWVMFKGVKINDASRWLIIFGIRFQPSEIAKMAVVIMTASILDRMQGVSTAHPQAFRRILIIAVVFFFLIVFDNLSTAALLCVTVFLMMVIGRVPFKQWGLLLLAVVVAGALFLTFLRVTPGDALEKIPLGHRMETWKNRIFGDSSSDTKVLSPQDFAITDDNRQEVHANIAIASSNGIGVGPGNSVERDFLPQAYSDFIYAILLEEFGLLGGIVVVSLYGWLLIRTGKIANKCDKDFPALLIMGVALLMVTQAVFNMLVAVGIAPVTGQPLPLISRGGTSTLINCVYIGLILSVSRYNNLREATRKALQEGDTEEVKRLEAINADSEPAERLNTPQA